MHTVKPWTLPQCYVGAEWRGFYSAGFGQSRDSDVLERSNFQVACNRLMTLDSDTPDGEECTVQIVRENHWAVGWVEWIAIHESNAPALDLARELCSKANDYPILDESHFSDLEWSEANDYWERMSISERLDYTKDCGLPCFAARHGISEIMYKYDSRADRLWESLTGLEN